MAKDLTTVHPSIRREMTLLDKSVEMADRAASAISDGSLPAKDCNVLLGSGRLYQGAARQSLTNRLAASRIAMQEAKLVEATT